MRTGRAMGGENRQYFAVFALDNHVVTSVKGGQAGACGGVNQNAQYFAFFRRCTK